jgi:hypothetical protein
MLHPGQIFTAVHNLIVFFSQVLRLIIEVVFNRKILHPERILSRQKFEVEHYLNALHPGGIFEGFAHSVHNLITLHPGGIFEEVHNLYMLYTRRIF